MGQPVFLIFSAVPVVSFNSIHSPIQRQKQESHQVLNFVLNDVSLPYVKLNTVSTTSTFCSFPLTVINVEKHKQVSLSQLF